MRILILDGNVEPISIKGLGEELIIDTLRRFSPGRKPEEIDEDYMRFLRHRFDFVAVGENANSKLLDLAKDKPGMIYVYLLCRDYAAETPPLDPRRGTSPAIACFLSKKEAVAKAKALNLESCVILMAPLSI